MKKLMVLLVLALVVAGCAQQAQAPAAPPAQNSGGSGATGGAAGGTAPAVVIHIKNFAFDPAQVSVKQGQTVEWVNDDTVSHSIKFGSFSSQTLASGASFTHTFSEAPGDYAYSCGIHPSMQGTVTVSG